MRAANASENALRALAEKEPLGFEAIFSTAEAEQLQRGFTPEAMEDKWLIRFEKDWLYFHRSWTGILIYAVRLECSPTGMQAVESWVNRDQEQYTACDAEYDRKLVRFLIDALLLNKPAVIFPRPANSKRRPKGLLQHVLAGTACPEEAKPGSLLSSWKSLWHFIRRRFYIAAAILHFMRPFLHYRSIALLTRSRHLLMLANYKGMLRCQKGTKLRRSSPSSFARPEKKPVMTGRAPARKPIRIR